MSTWDRRPRTRRKLGMSADPGFSFAGGAVHSNFLGSSAFPAVSPRRPLGAPRMCTPPPTSSTERRRVRARDLARVAIASAGIVAGGWIGGNTSRRIDGPPRAVASEVTTRRPSDPIPLNALGIKQSDYLGERELRMRKTTQYSEAEEEIMELEEYEVATKWFRDLQALWAGVASIAGIMVLYKGGVLWERWIQEQERKDMEEEIQLTGTFISPRAVRKDDEEEDGKGKSKKKKGDDDGKPPIVGDSPPGGIEGLNKLLGKN